MFNIPILCEIDLSIHIVFAVPLNFLFDYIPSYKTIYGE